MIRAAAGLLTLFVTGFPLLVGPGSVTGLLALVAAALCAGGILNLSVSLLAAGAGLALVEYAFALLVAGGPPDVVGALAVGVALSLLLQTVSFAARFRGAAVEAQVVREQVRAWLGSAVLAAALGAALTLGAWALGVGIPSPISPALAALGALLATAGIVGILRGLPARRPGGGEEGR